MRSSTWWMIGGILCLVGGVLALLNPFAGTMAATMVAGWAFIFAGILQVVAAFNASGGWNKLFLAIFGILGVLVGITIFRNPLEGMLTLTVAVAVMILVSGVVRLFVAKDLKGTNGYGWVMISAIASIILAVMIFANFPQSAATILGILLGVELIFDGVALIGLSNAAKRIEGALGGAS